MKKLSIGLFILVAMLVVGCASMRDVSILMTDEHIANIETTKKNAIKIAEISGFKTCFIRSCLGSYIDQIPHEMIITLDGIDQLLEEIGEHLNTMTDCQKGQILGLWSRLVALGILEIIAEINAGNLAELL